MKKLAFIFSVLLVAVYFANLMYTDSKEAKIKLEQMLRKTTVDKAEMDRFLPVWAEYLEDGVSRIGARQISLTMGPASEKFPVKTVNWLAARGWNADRFFYVEQRMKAIVKSAFLQEHVKSTIRMLEQGGASGVDGSAVQRMIDEQKQRLGVEKISPAEIDMVTPDLVLISDILDGTKPISKIKKAADERRTENQPA